jgi:hypothetical protein
VYQVPASESCGCVANNSHQQQHAVLSGHCLVAPRHCLCQGQGLCVVCAQVIPVWATTQGVVHSVKGRTGPLRYRTLMWQPHTCTGGMH